nr:hypothetical protein [Komagataeibacter europaeus]
MSCPAPYSKSSCGLSRLLSLLVAGTALAVPLALPGTAGAHAMDCADLAHRAMPDATFTTVETVPGRKLAATTGPVDPHHVGAGHECGGAPDTGRQSRILPCGHYAASVI